MGLVPYYLYRQKNIAGNFENVGYAKVDKAGIYNILIMEEKQSITCGRCRCVNKNRAARACHVPGSRMEKARQSDPDGKCEKHIEDYIGRIDEMIERKGEWLWH